MTTLPIVDLTTQYEILAAEIDAAVKGVFGSGHYIMGPNVAAFEREIAQYIGTPFAIAVNSGTDALHLALRSLGIGPGDEVITTPFTFAATSEAIGIVGATPVFVDIDPETYNLDPSKIEAAITRKTRAILPVHLYGRPAPMVPIMEIARKAQLFVVEDCAQAIGARVGGRQVGTFGDFGCFSFFPSKNLGCYGDGGLLTTASEDLAEQARMLRVHGSKIKYSHSSLGINSRLDEVQAAILRVKLRHLDGWNLARRAAASRYDVLLAEVPGVKIPTPDGDGQHSVFHQYTVRVDDRATVQSSLAKAQIQSMVYYPIPLHLQQVHADLGYTLGSMPHSERAAQEVLSLPIFPELSSADQVRVAIALQDALAILDPA
ncbi:MAG TPA: DegT/DnrJ/EryC1/StrS family aminotransferase [Candidatus Dormibacteraeota bacterium]|nr:DegT/DnrJ/EryC1/StrS family aminotransferase [Candidatus Dormibacteraeota bacterium]